MKLQELSVPSSPRSILVAGASVRSVAESVCRLGHHPICVDLFCDWDLRNLISNFGFSTDCVQQVTSFEDVVEAVADFDPTIPLVPLGGLELRQEILKQIALVRPVYSMPSTVVDSLRNPTTFFPVLQADGIPVPRFFIPSDEVSWSSHRGGWLKKNLHSSGGQAVVRIDFGNLSVEQEQLADGEFLQEEIAGIPCSATFLATGNRRPRFLGAALQIVGRMALGATGFQFCGNAGPFVPSSEIMTQLHSIADSIHRHWPVTGVFGIDFILNDNRVVPIELNPRITASHEIHETQSSVNHISLHSAAFERQAREPPEVPTPTSDSPVIIRMILYSDQLLNVSTALHQILANRSALTGTLPEGTVTPKTEPPKFCISDIPHPGTIIQPGEPICSLKFRTDRTGDPAAVWSRAVDAMVADLPTSEWPFAGHSDISELIKQTMDRLDELNTVS